MDTEKYEFSKESEAELLEFLKVAKNNCKNINENKNLWFQLLPPNHAVLEKLNVLHENVIIIDDDEAEVAVNTTISSTINVHEQSTITISTNDLIDEIVENLELEQSLTQETLNTLNQTCTHKQLEEIFNTLSNTLSNDNIYNLGNTLNANVGSKKELLIEYFCKHLLLKKLASDQSEILVKLCTKFFNSIPHILITVLSKFLEDANNCSEVFLENIEQLDLQHKNKLLIYFLSNCSQMEKQHLNFFYSLLENRIDSDIIKKITNLMVNAVDNYTTDKMFGKLLIKIIECSGKIIFETEQQLRIIISKYKNVLKLKNKASMILDDFISNNMLSQSFQ